jgi:hypothetical protein
MGKVSTEIAEAIREVSPPRDQARIAEAARNAARRALSRYTGRKPVVLVSVTTQATPRSDAT